MTQKKQKIEIDVTCSSVAQAERVVNLHRKFKGVISVTVIGTVITTICEVAADYTLIAFGKLKDFAFGCPASVRPVQKIA